MVSVRVDSTLESSMSAPSCEGVIGGLPLIRTVRPVQGEREFMSVTRVLLHAYAAALGVLFIPTFAAGAELSASPASPKEVAPDTLIRGVTEEVLLIVKQNTALQSGGSEDRKKLIALIEVKVAPHFDFEHMTRLAMGVHWRKATTEERKLLVQEFRALLLHVYSGTLLWSQGNTIDYKSPRMRRGGTDSLVRLSIRRPSAGTIAIGITMEKTPTGWMAYDITIDGVSLIATYRDSFASEVERLGIDGLIKELAKKNQQLKK